MMLCVMWEYCGYEIMIVVIIVLNSDGLSEVVIIIVRIMVGNVMNRLVMCMRVLLI